MSASSFRPYKNLDGNAGILSYISGKDFILIEFADHSLYLYDIKSTGKKNIETMKKLAESGRGLTTFINKFVRENFAEKLR